jgi:hypothetical protein
MCVYQATPEESERRKRRRERNKVAAAKCRNKKKEKTDCLLKVSSICILKGSTALLGWREIIHVTQRLPDSVILCNIFIYSKGFSNKVRAS